ncbi:type IV secretory system conjugative DNA transfer family protein [Aliiroseovarius sp.]|uniref:type IV secretory system conjugative DNA transfer family protein n=1 Tax=Aliiroseovarius sp. TaxID=1872442 RepID=UPI003BA9BC1E
MHLLQVAISCVRSRLEAEHSEVQNNWVRFSLENVTTLGLAFRNSGSFPFGIRLQDRLSHLYIIGQTGTGKSTLIEHMARQDAAAGIGFCVIDPHGDLAEHLAGTLGEATLYWRVADPDSPYGYNPLTRTSSALRPLVVSGLVDALKAQWADAWGARMEHLLRYAVLALLERPQTNMQDILRLYLEHDFRAEVLHHVKDEQVLRFWQEEFPAMNYKTAADGIAPIANKLGAFLAHPVVRRAVCEPREPLRFRQIMDEGRVLIINLEKGRLGSDIANVLGGLLVSSMTHAAFTRSAQAETERRPFMLYVDEFHSFTTQTIADLLSETRKYRLGVTLSQQHAQQSDPAVFASVMGNCGNLICFRTGALDTPLMSSQLGRVEPHNITMQPNYNAFVRLLVSGERIRSFSMTTIPPDGCIF